MVRRTNRRRKDIVIKESDAAWMRKALCIGINPEDFFPPDVHDVRRPTHIDTYIETVCGRCPVKTNCLNFAMIFDMKGIWGGTTDYTREQLRKKTNKPKCPGCRSESLFTEFTGEIICGSCGLSWTSL